MISIPTLNVAEHPRPAYRYSAELAERTPEVKILMVDDQPANLLALEAVLDSLGHTLVRARSGEDALKCLLHDDFAVILLDVFMPGMDGFETAEIIRQRERSRSTPIVFLTAMGKSDTYVERGYSVGGVDYLFKPIVPEILKAKVAAFVDMFLKTAMVAEQAELLREFERQRHQAALDDVQRQLEGEKLLQDVRAARKVQQSLFPHCPPSCPGFDIAGASYPADATGGDYFDYISTAKGFLDVVIGDVSGHGLAAALLMSSTRAYLRSLALAGMEIEDVLTLANRALVADMEEDSRFVTLLYARFTPGRLVVLYTSAGHQPGYVIDADGNVKATLDSTAMPLGIMMDGEFPAGPEIELQSGDLVLLLTDGVVEAVGPDGTAFGTDRALDVLRDNSSRTAGELVEELHLAVMDFRQQSLLEDDLTAIVIKVV
ncbi:MAG: SpoIIE family protein phosphatase [Pirellulales bacterium]